MRILPEDLKNYIGKKILNSLWKNKERAVYFIGFNTNGSLVCSDEYHRLEEYRLNFGEWETYEESKKKVKMCPVCKDQDRISYSNLEGNIRYCNDCGVLFHL